MDVNLAPKSILNIANSTFYNNEATAGDANGSQADALDFYGVAASAVVYIMNSTFVGHATGAIDFRPNTNVDLNGDFYVDDGYDLVEISMSNTVYLDSGRCSATAPVTVHISYEGRLYVSQSNVFSPFDATCDALNDIDANITKLKTSV